MVIHTDHGTVILDIEVPEFIWKHFNHNKKTMQNFFCDAIQLHCDEISIQLEDTLKDLKQLTEKLSELKKEELELMMVIENESN